MRWSSWAGRHGSGRPAVTVGAELGDQFKGALPLFLMDAEVAAGSDEDRAGQALVGVIAGLLPWQPAVTVGQRGSGPVRPLHVTGQVPVVLIGLGAAAGFPSGPDRRVEQPSVVRRHFQAGV